MSLGAALAAGLLLWGLDRLAGRAPSGRAVSPERLGYLFDASSPFFRAVFANGQVWLLQSPRTQGLFADPQQVFLAEKRPGTKRVFLVGESSGLFLGEQLRGLLKRSPYDPAVEFVNCGIGAAGLEQVERVFDEVSEYSPDAVIVFFGNNLLTVQPELRPLPFSVARLLRVSRLLRRLNAGPGRDAGPQERLKRWEKFLRRAAAASRRKGFRLVVCTVQGNLWWPPGRRAEEDERYLAAVFDYYSGRRGAAIDQLVPLVRETGSQAWAFRLGDWLHERGRRADALEYLRMSAEANRDVPRARSDFNELTRRVAGEEGVELFDEAAWVVSESPAGIPGWGLFDDDCHLTSRGFERAGFALLRQLQQSGFLEPAPAWKPVFAAPDGLSALHVAEVLVRDSVPPDAAAVEALSYKIRFAALEGRPFAAGEIDGFLSEGRGDPLARAGVAVAAAEAYFRLGRKEDALRANGRAVDIGAKWPDPYLQRALFRLPEGKNAACPDLQRAVALEPARREAAYFAARLGCR